MYVRNMYANKHIICTYMYVLSRVSVFALTYQHFEVKTQRKIVPQRMRRFCQLCNAKVR